VPTVAYTGHPFVFIDFLMRRATSDLPNQDIGVKNTDKD
jgi:hypothetical protein